MSLLLQEHKANVLSKPSCHPKDCSLGPLPTSSVSAWILPRVCAWALYVGMWPPHEKSEGKGFEQERRETNRKRTIILLLKAGDAAGGLRAWDACCL